MIPMHNNTRKKNNNTTTFPIRGRKESYYQNTAGPTMSRGFEEGEGGSDDEQLQDSRHAP
jgi:hypothetical protein